MYIENKLGSSWFGLDRRQMLDNVDYLVVALAFSLPLSTSATGILAFLWLFGLLPTLNFKEVRNEAATLAGGLPVLLVLIAAIGTLWADVSWAARAAGLRPFLKLLAVPLLFVQFRRSDRGSWVVYALIAGCVLLMLASFTEMLLARGLIPGKLPGIVVKDYISQSGFCVLSIFLLLEYSERAFRAGRPGFGFAQIGLIIAFLIDIGFVATSRTTLLVIPILLLVFGLRRNWKVAVCACAIWAALFLVAWKSSPYLQTRLESAFSVSANDPRLDAVSNRQRLAYWEASIDLIKRAPFVGHGTGSIPSMFRNYTAAGPDSDVNRTANPHNQTFAIALQLGGLGAIVLYAMWFAHARMFSRAGGTATWFGVVVLSQNFFSSLVNSHLSDFTQGWTYVICIGVAGGRVLRDGTLCAVNSAQG